MDRFLDEHARGSVLHLHPQNLPAHRFSRRVTSIAFEDIDKDEHWLKINALISPQTTLLMENLTRYPKITSAKTTYLRRLSMMVGPRAVVDIVPFTLGIEYIYTPYACLDRAILGFAHWYAFKAGYQEMTTDGQLVSSHDSRVLARKVAPVTGIDGETLLPLRETVLFQCTASELTSYEVKKENLFNEGKSIPRIVTGLADFTHAMDSRRALLLELSASLRGRALFLCNLGSYANKLNAALKRVGSSHVADSYALAPLRTDLGDVEHLVYAESAIIKNYLAHDMESRLPRAAKVWRVRSDAKVDGVLYQRAEDEIGAIRSFTQALIEETHGQPQ